MKIKANILSPHHALLKVKHEPTLGGGMKVCITNLLSLGNSDIKCQIYKLPSALALTPAGIHSAVSTLELLLCRLHLGHVFFVNTNARELLFIFIKARFRLGEKKRKPAMPEQVKSCSAPLCSLGERCSMSLRMSQFMPAGS